MYKKIFIVFLVFMASAANAQFIRTNAMGGLSYSIIDKDNSLSPYDFGNNPAYLVEDEKQSFLLINPTMSNSWGDYRRKFDSEGITNIGTIFHGIKTLGELGTFSGYTSYNYENRRNYYRTIEKDSYAGDGFNITDTTSADFRYMGPKVVLMYSWEPLNKLYAGGYISYELLDGLKEKFSYAKTIYRKTEVNFGLAYNLFNNVILGSFVQYSNSQESIEASDVNLFDVELFYFRGDKYFISRRASSNTGKIKRNGFTFGSQLYWTDEDKLSLAAIVNYSPSNSKLLKPYSTSTTSSSQSYQEFEDSYSAFEFFNTQLKAQYKINENYLVAAYAGYFNDYSWSKLSIKDLVYWEWEKTQFVAGIGASGKLTDNLLLGFEYEFTNNNADSSKYIDRKFVNIDSNDHLIRLGAEYTISEDVYLRVGINYGTKEHDMIFGGNDCTNIKYTCGVCFPIIQSFVLGANINYVQLSPNSGNVKQSFLGGNVSLLINTF